MTKQSVASRFAGLSKLLTAFVVLALLAVMAIVLRPGDDKKSVTVDFRQANSLYEGSDVKILGVPVGTVESIDPKGKSVRVKISYDGKYKLPADVKAAIISPSIIGDRFVQLAPAYSDGATLANNAVLSIDRSNVPLELDEIFQSIDDLAVALGTDGANSDGSLSKLVDASAANLEGQGEQLNETIKNFGKLSKTLSNNKEELFGSVEEIEQFVSTLKKNDDAVRSFNDSTAEVASVLEGERDDLAGVLKNLSLALVDVHGFVKENRSALRGNIEDLTELSKTLAKHVDSIEGATKSGPTALANYVFSHNGKYGTVDNRSDSFNLLFGSFETPTIFLCSLLGEAVDEGGICGTLAPILDQLPGAGDLPSPRAAVNSPGNSLAPGHVHGSLQEMLAVS